jgi:hypothetical protein
VSCVLRLCKTIVVPCGLGLLLAGILAGVCLVLQAGLRRPSDAEQLAAQVVGTLERIRSTRTVEFVDGFGSVRSMCTAYPRSDQLLLGRRIHYTVVGTTAKAVGGRKTHSLYVAAQADLAACPRLIENELSARLLTGPPVRLYATRYSDMRAYALRINNRPPFVRLLIRRRTLTPLAVEFLGKRVQGFSRIVAMTLRHKRRTRRGADVFLSAPSP